jgi:hypothetical protein
MMFNAIVDGNNEADEAGEGDVDQAGFVSVYVKLEEL